MSVEARAVALPHGVSLWVRLVDATDPGSDAPTLVLLHGIAETGDAYRQWIPHLARTFRIVCPDLRGMGRSSPIAAGATLTIDELVLDVRALMQALGVARYALVGEKVGALVSLSLAAAHPGAVLGLALACGMVSPREVLGPWIPEWIRIVEEKGVRAWVDATQAGRMGDELSPPAIAWWSDLMARSDASALVAYLRMLQTLEVNATQLAAIHAPTLFLVPSQAAGGSARFEQRRPASETEAWQRHVKAHRVAAIDARSYHLAATQPDACALAARDFLREALATTPPERMEEKT